MIEIKNKDDILSIVDKEDVATASCMPASTDNFTITVRYIRAHSTGDSVCIGIELCDKSRNLSESRRYTVTTPLYADLGVCRGVITKELLSKIERAATLSAAWQRGLSILAYGANSAHALTLKLRQRGFDAEVAERAVELIRAQGYLHEDNDARREAERCLAKGWGLRRIGQYLRQRGYDADAVSAALEQLGDEDFDERCACVARKYCSAPPKDSKQKQKMIAHLLRYGYDMSEIRHAMEYAWQNDDNQ